MPWNLWGHRFRLSTIGPRLGWNGNTSPSSTACNAPRLPYFAQGGRINPGHRLLRRVAVLWCGQAAVMLVAATQVHKYISPQSSVCQYFRGRILLDLA